MQKLNLILLVILIVFLLNLCREYFFVDSFEIMELDAKEITSLNISPEKPSWNDYKSIFSSSTDKVVCDKSSLPFVLKGTVLSSPAKSFAVIEDIGSGMQELYKLGDIVADAKIVAMNRNSITVLYMGEKQEIKVFEGDDLKRDISADNVHVQRKLPLDFNKILKQVRIKPHFESGRCVGFQVSRIKNDSLVDQLGLRNGDVIETINGVKITDPLKALQLIYAIEQNNPVHLGVERANSKIEINCKIEG